MVGRLLAGAATTITNARYCWLATAAGTRGPHNPFFLSESDRANAAFLDVKAERMELWIRGVTPEPFGLHATTLERDAVGAWRLLCGDRVV